MMPALAILMKMKRFSIILFLASALLAQESQTGAPDINPATQSFHGEASKTVTLPAIPADHAAEYFAAAAAFARIEAVYKQVQASLEAARVKVIADCGPNATPNEGVAGKMVCDVKPEAPKAAPAK